MVKEISRNTWSKFCKKFSSDNRYRQFSVNAAKKSRRDDKIVWDSPFMGLALEKKGRSIDGIQLFSAWANPERAALPIVSLKQPVKMTLEKDKDGIDCRLMVHTKDGTQARIELMGDRNPNQHHVLVEKVAYSIYERRGCWHGNDKDDWLEAEKKVTETEMQFA